MNYFVNIKFDFNKIPKGFFVFGKGSIGGKGMGLYLTSFVREFLGEKIAGEYTHKIYIPDTYILTTEFFDRFLSYNKIFFSDAEKTRQSILSGTFDSEMVKTIRNILKRIKGPVAIRSSAVLEDNLKVPFAGIYHTFFSTNTGKNIEHILNLIKKVYASTYGENAIAYREKHNLPQEEKMAVIIQPMIGSFFSRYFYPLVAGVGFSKNFFPWSSRINPEHGVVRIVYGLGTQAVERGYARLFCPYNPQLRPEGMTFQSIIKYSQKFFDALDLEKNEIITLPINFAIKIDKNIHLVSSIIKDRYLQEPIGKISENERIVVTLNGLLKPHSSFELIPIIKNLFSSLERLLGIDLDIEFALTPERQFYLLQVRPLVSRMEFQKVEIPEVPRENIIFESNNAIGNGIIRGIKDIVYVNPKLYHRIEPPHTTARRVEELNKKLKGNKYILVGPGRWGTVNSYLGVPVTYAQISNASVIVELSESDFTPDFSFGTHFFGDLNADKTFYVAIFKDKGDYINNEFIQKHLASNDTITHIVTKKPITAIIDGRRRKALCFFEEEENNSQ